MLHKAQTLQGAVTTWKLMLQHFTLGSGFDGLHVSFSSLSCALQHHMSALVRTLDCIIAANRRSAKNMYSCPHVSKGGTTALCLGTCAAAFELNKLCLCRQGMMVLG